MFPSCLLAKCGISQTSQDSPPRYCRPASRWHREGGGGRRLWGTGLSPFPGAAPSGQGGSRFGGARPGCARRCTPRQEPCPGPTELGNSSPVGPAPAAGSAPHRAQPTRWQCRCLGPASRFTLPGASLPPISVLPFAATSLLRLHKAEEGVVSAKAGQNIGISSRDAQS